MVVTSAPSAWTARTVQLFTASPSTWHVQAPQLVVSQPTWEPVSPRWSRRKCTSSNRGSTWASCGSPFTVRRTWTMLPIPCSSPRDRLAAKLPPLAGSRKPGPTPCQSRVRVASELHAALLEPPRDLGRRLAVPLVADRVAEDLVAVVPDVAAAVRQVQHHGLGQLHPRVLVGAPADALLERGDRRHRLVRVLVLLLELHERGIVAVGVADRDGLADEVGQQQGRGFGRHGSFRTPEALTGKVGRLRGRWALHPLFRTLERGV